MDVNVSFDNSTMKFLYGAGYPGQQAFVDPTYFDDVDKILTEFTREILANQLQGFQECFANQHSMSKLFFFQIYLMRKKTSLIHASSGKTEFALHNISACLENVFL